MGTKERFYVDIMAAQQEVTGSCILFVVKLPNDETVRFIVDCGIFQEEEYQEYNKDLLFRPEQLDFALVTHNHADHVGRLPLLFHKGYRGNIFASEDTCALLHPALDDNFKIERHNAKRNNQKALYDEGDVQETKNSLIGCKYKENYPIHPNVNVIFLQNGHLPGASSIEIEIHYSGYESIYFDVTGDYKASNKFFDVPEIPQDIRKRPVTIITESTYGDTDTTEVEYVFENNLLKAIKEEKTVIVPVYSLGRAQEILYLLKCLQKNGKLDQRIPIYYDGNLSMQYSRMYINGRLHIKEEMRDFMPKDTKWVQVEDREFLVKDTNTKIIVTTSGNGNFGPAQQYLAYYVPREDALIHFTGFTPKGTAGAELLAADGDEIVKMGGMLLHKRAQIEYTGEFSAHAKADELIERLQMFKKSNMVLVTHGSEKAKNTFAKRGVKEVDTKAVAILDREYFYRVNAYGLVKTLPTKYPNKKK